MNMNYKDYTEWHTVKSTLQHRNPPTFGEREIWWCHLGLNIGTETDGKGNAYQRPVVIIKKFNRRSLMAVPLTTQIKDFPYHFHFNFHSKPQCAILSQMKKLDSLRLIKKMGEMPPEGFGSLKKAIHAMI